MAKKPSPLLLDGDTVKLRIQSERQATGSVVHVDWVRFTCPLRFAPVPEVDILFHNPATSMMMLNHDDQRIRVALSMRELKETDFHAASSAYGLAESVAAALGPDYLVEADYRKGMDFYKWRWSITLNTVEVAWVGFLASSNSPRQSKQSESVHVNIMGTACTFAASGWRNRIADLVESVSGVLTRADLALDFFDGISGGIQTVWDDYRAGLCDVGGRQLKFSVVGDWNNGNNRSVYIGSREAGKVTNVYEKGDQLYGMKAGSEWLRFELRYGSKLRFLSVDMLRRPDDFFAGASDWHQSVLSRACPSVVPQIVTCTPRLQIETVQAEVSRNLRWLANTAASSVSLAIKLLDTEKLWTLVEKVDLPGRLRKFSLSQITAAFGASFDLATAPAG